MVTGRARSCATRTATEGPYTLRRMTFSASGSKRAPSRWLRLLVATVALTFAAGCGSAGTSGDEPVNAEPQTEAPGAVADEAATDLPECDSVWQQGALLPEKYRGCLLDDEEVTPEVVDCSSGQRVMLYDNKYWAVEGHKIQYAPEGLDNSAAYAEMLYGCRA